jgi:hypothetical protein
MSLTSMPAIFSRCDVQTLICRTAKVPTEQPAPAIDLELPVDPNEPTYCLCNQVSYGEMVACDNNDVRVTFLHSPIIPA